MRISLDDSEYERLCKLADDRNTTPAQLARWWVQSELSRQWAAYNALKVQVIPAQD